MKEKGNDFKKNNIPTFGTTFVERRYYEIFIDNRLLLDDSKLQKTGGG
jgi:hypothetical protein